MKTPLWTPSASRIETSQLAAFTQFLCDQGYPNFDLKTRHGFDDLYQWSIERKTKFWESLWHFFDLRGSLGSQGAGAAFTPMFQATWFPDSSLNFAENLLRGRDQDIAIIEVGEDGLRYEYDYKDLRRQTARVAYWLQQQGVGKGDRVAGLLPNCHQSVVAMLATTSVGAIWSSCSPDFGEQGVIDRFAQITPKVLFACDGYQYAGKKIDTTGKATDIAASLNGLSALVTVNYLNDVDDGDAEGVFNHTTFNNVGWKSIVSAVAPENDRLQFEKMPFNAPVYILYSSGTTGKPKCIVHGAGGTLLQHFKELALHTDVRAQSRIFYYSTCGWMMWNWLVSSLGLGATIVLYDGSPFHPNQSRLFELAQAEQLNVLGASAKYYGACEKYGLKPSLDYNLDSVGAILSTGSPLPPESFNYIYRDIKQDVCVSSISGGTDIVSCFALGAPVLPVYSGEIQTPGLGMAIEFYDDAANPLKHGKGELVCTESFPSMPLGFWQDDGSRYYSSYFERFAGNENKDDVWAHGDYGEFVLHEDGDDTPSSFGMLPTQKGVVIHGRSDATLNPGGVRIGTAEIYRQVEKLDFVFESLAIGQKWQDDVRVVLFVVLQGQRVLSESDQTEIRQIIRANASPRHVPAKIIQVPELPRTLSGKLVELAVRQVVHGEPVKNKDALANPDALRYFERLVF